MSEEIRGYCWHCGGDLTRLDFGRESPCPGCAKPTHCCRNCRLYAPGRANECAEPQVERVIDKVRSNFCDWFEPSLSPLGPSGDKTSSDDLKAAADALFGPK